MKVFNLVLNVLWLVLCGIWMALGYLVAALVCFLLIVTIPFGIAALRIAGFVLWPFGRTTVDRPDAGAPSFLGNVIWVVLAGWWLALGHLLTSIPLFLSIIGIPFGWANLKLIPISLMPLGREVVSTDKGFGRRTAW
ncbi:YccF domain-containing protein [Streptomyces sp. NPDC003697]